MSSEFRDKGSRYGWTQPSVLQYPPQSTIHCQINSLHSKHEKQTLHELHTTHHHHNHFMALFPGPPGWAGARRELLDFMVQGKINKGTHTDHPAGRHSIRTNQFPPPPSPHYILDQFPASSHSYTLSETHQISSSRDYLTDIKCRAPDQFQGPSHRC